MGLSGASGGVGTILTNVPTGMDAGTTYASIRTVGASARRAHPRVGVGVGRPTYASAHLTALM